MSTNKGIVHGPKTIAAEEGAKDFMSVIVLRVLGIALGCAILFVT